MRLKLLNFNKVTFTVEPEPEMLLLYPYRDIWNRDDSPNKDKALAELAFVWLMTDISSPYNEMTPAERNRKLTADILDNIPADSLVQLACEEWEKMSETTSTKLLQSSRKSLDKLRDYMDNIEFTKEGDQEEAGKNAKKLVEVVSSLSKLLSSVKGLEELVAKEQTQETKVRRGAEINEFNA
jgi:hypothetical protein